MVYIIPSEVFTNDPIFYFLKNFKKLKKKNRSFVLRAKLRYNFSSKKKIWLDIIDHSKIMSI